MTERVMTDANGRKYITTEPAPQPDWKEEYLKAVELHCITLDELREGMALNRKLEKTIATQESIMTAQAMRIVDLKAHIENFEGN